ncbi:MAG: hypothetical protein RR424_10950, partial [Oscillospiraceae bacterium]
MANLAYIDDNKVLCNCFLLRDYSELKNDIFDGKYFCTEAINKNNDIYGFNITDNASLTKIYGYKVKVVKFCFSSVATLHNDEQLETMIQLCLKLKEKMCDIPAYYDVRIPTHIIDLVKAFNLICNNAVFCGCTIEEVFCGKSANPPENKGLNLYFSSEKQAKEHKEL